jgi:hypothetical protein
VHEQTHHNLPSSIHAGQAVCPSKDTYPSTCIACSYLNDSNNNSDNISDGRKQPIATRSRLFVLVISHFAASENKKIPAKKGVSMFLLFDWLYHLEA